MKKILLLSLVLLLVASLALTGCSSKDEVVELSFATGGTSGTYYPLGGAIAAVWNENIADLNVTIQPAGASVENINRLASGEVDLGLAMNNVADSAYNGLGESFPEALTNFYAIGVVYPEVMHVVTTQKSGIESIADLQGKRINPGPPGSGTYVTAMEILAAFGVDDYDSNPGSFTDAVAGMKDGTLDAAFAVIAFPGAAVVEMGMSRDVKILEIDGADFDAVQELVPFAAPFTITGGAYKGQDEDAMTIALQAVLYSNDKITDDQAYNLAKYLYEKTEDITAGHARGSQISIDTALDGITTPFHPGAIKYYQEVGIMD